MSEGITSNQLQAGVVSVLGQTVVLTDAQIKASPTTSILIVPHPGPGMALEFVVGTLGPLNGVPYTNIDGSADMTLEYGSPAQTDACKRGGSSDVVDLLGGTSWIELGSLAQYNGRASWLLESTEDLGIYLKINNGVAGNFTGGDAGNALPVSVLYYVKPLS